MANIKHRGARVNSHCSDPRMGYAIASRCGWKERGAGPTGTSRDTRTLHAETRKRGGSVGMRGLDDMTGAIVDAAASSRRDPRPGTVGLLIQLRPIHPARGGASNHQRAPATPRLRDSATPREPVSHCDQSAGWTNSTSGHASCRRVEVSTISLRHHASRPAVHRGSIPRRSGERARRGP